MDLLQYLQNNPPLKFETDSILRTIMDNLTVSLQALPPEIFNIILDLTFTPDHTEPVLVKCEMYTGHDGPGDNADWTLTPSSNERVVDSTYKPPKFLHINDATRQHFAQNYYGNGSIFYIVAKHIESFLLSLPLEHAELIRDIRSLEERDLSELSVARQAKSMGFHLILYDALFTEGYETGKFQIENVRVKIVLSNGTVKWADLEDLLEHSFGRGVLTGQ